MQSKSNPAVNRLKGARSVGVSCPSTSDNINDHRVVGDGVAPQLAVEEPRSSTSSSSTRKKRKLEETEDTKYLSSNELQRMLLLKQLRVLQLKEELCFMKAALRMESESQDESEFEGNKSSLNNFDL